MLFLWTVIVISTAVIYFRLSYIRREKFSSRFFLILLSFIASIILLILRPNFISLLLGWDGLGVTSYLLVIYYAKPRSYNAGMLTAITNRIGDALLLVSISLLLIRGRWEIFRIKEYTYFQITVIVLFVVATFTKRAQLPFSAWLPAAIAAPTPVSSLVHSSTLVTAGVYVLLRFDFLLYNSQFNKLVLITSLATTIAASFAALFETDSKKIVALSTLSQLGVIITALGLQLTTLCFFHLIAHAYFKALLFICVGVLIHSRRDYQDSRVLSSNFCMHTFSSFILIANGRLCALPYMAAFYSKESILSIILTSSEGFLVRVLFRVRVIITTIYSIRLISSSLVFSILSTPLATKKDNDTRSLYGCSWLLFPALTAGASITWLILPVFPAFAFPLYIKVYPLALIIIGILRGGLVNLWIALGVPPVLWRLGRKGGLPFISTRLWLYSAFQTSQINTQSSDWGWQQMLYAARVKKIRVSLYLGTLIIFSYSRIIFILGVYSLTIIILYSLN